MHTYKYTYIHIHTGDVSVEGLYEKLMSIQESEEQRLRSVLSQKCLFPSGCGEKMSVPSGLFKLFRRVSSSASNIFNIYTHTYTHKYTHTHTHT